MAKRMRLDQLLVEKGLFETRTKAAAAIMAGDVSINGQKQTKAGFAAPFDADISLAEAPRFASRGGLKLESALNAFPVGVKDRVCVDVGASTGGFTDCLLQRGAAKVYAIDVGTAQLDARLKADPRVLSREQTHAKELLPEQFRPRPDLCAIDVSFISLAQVLPYVLPCLARPCDILALVKPQFEVGPKLAPKGVVRDPAARLAAVDKIRAGLPALGLAEAGLLECPVHGPKGNVEYFLWLK